MNRKFCGSLVAIVTPMETNGALDYAALGGLLEWHLAEGCDGIVIAGTTGESPTLSFSEHQKLIAETVRLVDGRVPVIAGVGANSTEEAISLTRQAQADGADAGLSVVPYYNKPMQEGLYRHFAAIAESCDLPIILYDVPGRTVTALADTTVARLAQLPTIVGIKDATGEVGRCQRLRQEITDEHFILLSGDDGSCCDYMIEGGQGVISVTANIAPKNMQLMTAAACGGAPARARAIDALLQPFHQAQSVETNPIPVKAALAMMGKIQAGIRLPLTPLEEQYYDRVQEAVDSAQRIYT